VAAAPRRAPRAAAPHLSRRCDLRAKQAAQPAHQRARARQPAQRRQRSQSVVHTCSRAAAARAGDRNAARAAARAWQRPSARRLPPAGRGTSSSRVASSALRRAADLRSCFRQQAAALALIHCAGGAASSTALMAPMAPRGEGKGREGVSVARGSGALQTCGGMHAGGGHERGGAGSGEHEQRRSARRAPARGCKWAARAARRAPARGGGRRSSGRSSAVRPPPHADAPPSCRARATSTALAAEEDAPPNPQGCFLPALQAKDDAERVSPPHPTGAQDGRRTARRRRHAGVLPQLRQRACKSEL
jgi:hypothetical protein